MAGLVGTYYAVLLLIGSINIYERAKIIKFFYFFQFKFRESSKFRLKLNSFLKFGFRDILKKAQMTFKIIIPDQEEILIGGLSIVSLVEFSS